MNRKLLLFLCLISLILMLVSLNSDVQALGTDIFVSDDGTGTSCTQAAPCSPAQALAKANDGDRLYFKHGEYKGTADNILTINKGISLYGGWDGAETGTVVLDPEFNTTTISGQDERRLMLVDYTSVDPAPIRIIGFYFINGKATDFGGAIYIKNGGVLVADNQFHYNYAGDYGGAIYVESSQPVAIQGNLFTENQAKFGGGAISVIVKSDQTDMVSIVGNQFSGGSANYGTAMHVLNTVVHITQNLLTDVGGKSAITLVSHDDVLASKFTNNLIVRSKKALEFSTAAITSHLVWNNTIVDCEVGIEVGDSHVEVVNNIFTVCDDASITVGPQGALTGSNNLFYNCTPPDPNPLSHNLEDVPPSFVNADSDDYHLAYYSEAIDAGAAVDLIDDFDGDARPSGSGYDIGADEFMSSLYLFLPLILR